MHRLIRNSDVFLKTTRSGFSSLRFDGEYRERLRPDRYCRERSFDFAQDDIRGIARAILRVDPEVAKQGTCASPAGAYGLNL